MICIASILPSFSLVSPPSFLPFHPFPYFSSFPSFPSLRPFPDFSSFPPPSFLPSFLPPSFPSFLLSLPSPSFLNPPSFILLPCFLFKDQKRRAKMAARYEEQRLKQEELLRIQVYREGRKDGRKERRNEGIPGRKEKR